MRNSSRKVISWADLPPIMYHATMSLNAVLKDGYLKASGDLIGAGAGGMESVGVSLVPDRRVAEMIAQEFQLLADANKVNTIAEAHRLIENFYAPEIGASIRSEFDRLVQLGVYDGKKSKILINAMETAGKAAISKKMDFYPHCTRGLEYMRYLFVIFGKHEKTDKGGVGVVAVRKEDIPRNAFIIEGVDDYLDEYRVIDNVPIRGGYPIAAGMFGTTKFAGMAKKKDEPLDAAAKRLLASGINPMKTKFTQGYEGVRFESKMYGCYDKGMNPHPEWEMPSEYNGNPTFPVYYIGSSDRQAILTATYHPFPDFILPEDATFLSDESASAKLSKNKRKSLVLYMSPVRRNSFAFNTCSMASIACEMVCLDYSGQKVGQQKQRLAIARTDFYYAHREKFFNRVFREIMAKDRKVNKNKPIGERVEIAVRLNGTSDLPVFKQFSEWCVTNGIRMPKNIVFYDYTKVAKNVTTHADKKNPTTEGNEYNNAFLKIQPDSPVRHKVTYSLSEMNFGKNDAKKIALDILRQGGSVAAVFLINPRGIPMYASEQDKKDGKKVRRPKTADGRLYAEIQEKYYEPLPLTMSIKDDRTGKVYTFPIVDGDMTDDLMLDLPKGGAVLGLRAKARAQYDSTGFAIPATALIDANDPKSRKVLEDIFFDLTQDREVINLACNVPESKKQKRPMRFQCSDTQKKEGSVIETW